MLGLNDNLVKFDFEQMKFTKDLKTKSIVNNIEKVNGETFLTGEFGGNLKLINK